MAGNGQGGLDLPRVLCLHGGGVNGEVFQMQCRNLIVQLKEHFRLCFVDAPFICEPHPSIVTVYGDHGPFRRWLRWRPEHGEIDDETASSQIEYQLKLAMEEDDERGGTGPWVGLLGFSQGAKIAASLLFTQQKLEETVGKGASWADFRFGVLLAGRAPVVLLDSRLAPVPGVAAASELSTGFGSWPDRGDTAQRIGLPTIHVHGLRDEGLQHHRRLLELYCEEGTTTLVEWDGEHRVPIKAHDVEAVAKEMIALGSKLGLAS
jgi:predicted esterase